MKLQYKAIAIILAYFWTFSPAQVIAEENHSPQTLPGKNGTKESTAAGGALNSEDRVSIDQAHSVPSSAEIRQKQIDRLDVPTPAENGYTVTPVPPQTDVSLEPIVIPAEPIAASNFPKLPVQLDIDTHEPKIVWPPAGWNEIPGAQTKHYDLAIVSIHYALIRDQPQAWELFDLTYADIKSRFRTNDCNSDDKRMIWFHGCGGYSGGGGYRVRYKDNRVCSAVSFSADCQSFRRGLSFETKQDALTFSIKQYARMIDTLLDRFTSQASLPLSVSPWFGAKGIGTLNLDWSKLYSERARVFDAIGLKSNAKNDRRCSQLALQLDGLESGNLDKYKNTFHYLATNEQRLGSKKLLKDDQVQLEPAYTRFEDQKTSKQKP